MPDEEIKNVVVRKKVYQIIKGPGSKDLEDGKKLQVAQELHNAVDEKIIDMLIDASNRAIANKRKTVYPRDL